MSPAKRTPLFDFPRREPEEWEPIEPPPRKSEGYRVYVPEDTSPVVEGEGGWLLNPNSSFPITVSCGHKATAQKIKRILEKSREMPFDEAVAVLADTMYRKGARIRELDARQADARAACSGRHRDPNPLEGRWASRQNNVRRVCGNHFQIICG